MKQLHFSAICLDMDGVLIQSRNVIEVAWTNAAASRGIAIDADIISKHIHGRPGAYTLDYLFSKYSPSERVVIKREVDAFEQTAQCDLVDGVADFIKSAKKYSIPLALVTSSWQERIAFILSLHTLSDYFDVIVDRHSVKNGKPAPDAYQLAMEKMQKNPSDCLVFEDSVSGVKAGVLSGAQCIGVGEESEALLEAGALMCIPHFSALLNTCIFEDNQISMYF